MPWVRTPQPRRRAWGRDERGRDPRRIVVEPVRHYRCRVDAVHRFGGTYLPAEAPDELGIAGQFRVDDLYRDRPAGW